MVWSLSVTLRSAVIALLSLISVVTNAVAADNRLRVRVITDDFVLKGKLDRLAVIAGRNGAALDYVYVEHDGRPQDLVSDVDLVILDTPRPNDVAKVEERVGSALKASTTPWIRVGGGPPASGNLAPAHARQLHGYFASGGEANLTALFRYMAAVKSRVDVATMPAPVALPANGFYHPAAAAPFATLDDYLAWGSQRWRPDAPRVAVIIHAGLLANIETKSIDAIVARSETAGMTPIVVWFEAADPEALQKMLGSKTIDAIVIATHLQNGPARTAEFAKLCVPVLQALSNREGTPDEWEASSMGIPQRQVAPFLALPESWGVIDPLVIEALASGEQVPMLAQIDALVAKVAKLAALRRTPAAAKQLALMFWNYPPGDKNFSASNLNVPRSLERLTAALAEEGYDVPALDEKKLIETGQALLGGIYHPKKLPALHASGLAATLPLSRYLAWFEALPQARRQEMLARWGQPDTSPSVFEIDGEKQFVIPRYQAGRLTLMPQPQRGEAAGANYHDAKVPPPHAYLAAYLLLADMRTDALIHFGTHGTQEWTPGKDRGLSVNDYPFLTLGDLPVFYPYVQDNIAEAIQAKRRGRAVTISHQTPPFVPAGLYDELRDIHARIHEYIQLDEGAVRDGTAAEIRRLVIKANLHRDIGWDEARMEREFPAFMHALHDHVHELAAHAMPLGLHTFGEAATPEHRVATIMQQLGKSYYKLFGSDPDEFFAADFKTLQDSPPYRALHRHLIDKSEEASDSAELKAIFTRAEASERNLASPGETEALLAALVGRRVAPGPGGDPIRNPDVPSGRNLFPFEPDKIPTQAAYEAGATALEQLVEAYQGDHNGETPQKLAFSLWGSETMRHLGIQESQILHALGLRPVWNEGGRLVRLSIIPRGELKRPRIDVVLQVTSVYRDQFDGFMRMLAEAIERLAVSDEPDNAVARNARALEQKLVAAGREPEQARRSAMLRIFGNASGDYGTSLPGTVLKSASWDGDAMLAEAYLDRLQYAYGSKAWGARLDGTNLLAEQLRGVQAAVLSRSSRLHGLLSTDHPYEYLGGLSMAIRHLDGKSPSLYVADLRESVSKVSSAARMLSDEMRGRYLNPQWIAGMQNEGYAGTLEILNAVNNLFGWQVTDPATVRADQWQAVHATFVQDKHRLGLAQWFSRNNPTAEGQIIERMIEAVRKGYWQASEQTQRELVERWRELGEEVAGFVAPATREFIEGVSAGLGKADGASAPSPMAAMPSQAGEQVRGAVLKPVQSASTDGRVDWQPWAGIALLLACFAMGAIAQAHAAKTSFKGV